jgi:hypothetical protein
MHPVLAGHKIAAPGGAPAQGRAQRAYDLEIAARELADEIKKIPTLTEAA